jgi:predicted transposase/invertase (TIGR01784 family)
MMVNLHEWELTERAKKQGWEEGKIEGQKEGAEQKAIETANKLMSMGLTIEQVAEGTGLPLEKVQELAKS